LFQKYLTIYKDPSSFVVVINRILAQSYIKINISKKTFRILFLARPALTCISKLK
jgi:hypothetical protein